MGRPWQDKDTLEELYVGEGLTTTEIGKQLDCGEGTVWRWLDKHDIERRNRGPKRKHTELQDEDWLREQYHCEQKTAYEIAEELGCTNGNVYYWMRKHGIDIREKHNGQLPEEPCLTDKEWLKNEYVEKRRSAREIASELDVTPANVIYWTDKHDIQKPTLGRLYYGPNWGKKRKKRREKDGNECVVCSMTNEEHKSAFGKALEVHHIQPLREFTDKGEINYERANAMDNLITLCISCHSKWEGIPIRPSNGIV